MTKQPICPQGDMVRCLRIWECSIMCFWKPSYQLLRSKALGSFWDLRLLISIPNPLLTKCCWKSASQLIQHFSYLLLMFTIQNIATSIHMSFLVSLCLCYFLCLISLLCLPKLSHSALQTTTSKANSLSYMLILFIHGNDFYPQQFYYD